MAKLSKTDVHKGNVMPGSFFDLVTSRFVSKPLVPLLAALGVRNPNMVTLSSFVVLLLACVLLILLDMERVAHRVLVVLTIEASFTLDCADGQLARMLKKASVFGAWLDKYLDRIGEMILYTALGYYAWLKHGRFLFFILGLAVGYLFTLYTTLYSMKESIIYRSGRKEEPPKTDKREGKNANRKRVLGGKYFEGKPITKVAFFAFFFVNIDIGERYLYPIFFLLIDRVDIMLIIVTSLFSLRVLNMFAASFSSLKSKFG
jgi:phosphatidylglycerophosphate synthase